MAALGTYVGGHDLTRIDAGAVALRGSATPLARFFTLLGRWYALLAVAVLAALLMAAIGGDARPVVALFVSQVLAQGVVSLIKHRFHRTRPDYWLVRLEGDTSFPSGHAATAMIFYLGLLLLVAHAPGLPASAAAVLTAALAFCVTGIPWSRLALGAHYVTDVAGGMLFGAGWLCASLALAQTLATSSRISL